MVRRLVTIAALISSLAPKGAAAGGEPDLPVEIAADRVIVDDAGEVSAIGDVKIRAGGFVLEAERVRLLVGKGTLESESRFRLLAEGIVLAGEDLALDLCNGDLRASSPVLEVRGAGRTAVVEGESAECSDGRCVVKRGRGTACPHTPAGYFIEADEIVLEPSGDLELFDPALVVDGARVAALPWYVIRPPDEPDFLWPRLGWSPEAGVVYGPGGRLPIGRDTAVEGYAAVRTFQGVESSATFESPHSSISLEYLLDLPDHHARGRFHIAPPLDPISLVLEGDIVDERMIVDELTFDPMERALTHTVSRALFAIAEKDLLVEGFAVLLQPLGDGASSDGLFVPAFGASISLPRIAGAVPLWPGLSASVVRREAGGVSVESGAPPASIPAHTRVDIGPSLLFPKRLGPIAARVEVASRHRLWIPDDVAVSRSSRHVVAGSAELSLPLVGHPLGLSHRLSPVVRYRASPWTKGEPAGWIADDLDRLVEGHGIEVGLQSLLRSRSGSTLLDIDLWERFDLPGLGSLAGPAYIRLLARLGLGFLAISADASWDHDEDLPSHGILDLSTGDGRGTELGLGGAWYGPGRGAHTDLPWSAGTSPWLVGTWASPLDERLELLGRVALSITRRVGLRGGARVGVVPSPELHTVWYGVELRSSCGCVRASLDAAHRPGSWFPDVIATASISGP